VGGQGEGGKGTPTSKARGGERGREGKGEKGVDGLKWRGGLAPKPENQTSPKNSYIKLEFSNFVHMLLLARISLDMTK